MSTKDEERKALEKIRKIVADLGEDSYIGMAFAGCFEDAERNIDEDAAYSNAERAERYEIEMANAKRENAELKKKLSKAEDKIKEMDDKALLPADLMILSEVVGSEIRQKKQAERAAAERIVMWASDTDDEHFKEAVAQHRGAQAAIEKYEKVEARLFEVRGVRRNGE